MPRLKRKARRVHKLACRKVLSMKYILLTDTGVGETTDKKYKYINRLQ